MQGYLQKFNQLYEGKTFIEIEIITDNGYSSKYSRSNQSGQVCYCMTGTNQAYHKTTTGWEKIECQGQDCQYRQKKDNTKSDCSKVAWLKFLIPKITTDRIWLMKITSQQAVNSLDEYFSLQREQRKSIKGKYILFLKQVENSKNGKTFSNYIVDIMKKEDFISNTQIPEEVENTPSLSTTNEQNVNNKVENTKEQQKATKKPKEESKETKSTKSKAKKIETITVAENPDVDKCYYLTNHHIEKFNKNGKPTEYFIGEFYDMTDKPVNLIVKPELIDIILQCGIGSIFETEIQEFKGKKILTNIKFVQNNEKNIAA